MRIYIDRNFYSDVLTRSAESSEPTYLCYSLCDKFPHWLVTPYLFSSLDTVRSFCKLFPDMVFYVGEMPAKAHPNEVKRCLAEHYRYQIFGDTYKKPIKRNLFDLKLKD